MRARLLMMSVIVLLAALESAVASRLRPVTPPPSESIFVTDDFRMGQRGWEASFADYSPVSNDMQLASGIRPLPRELGVDGTGFFMAGHNRSDDLFMFLTKRLTTADGIQPNALYRISFRIVFASQAGSECGGIGGPADSVYLKAGASGEMPLVTLSETNQYRVNFDKGNQIIGGTAASLVSTTTNGSSNCGGDAPFITVTRDHTHTSLVRASPTGELWLIVGTDSGFEGYTQLYYQSIGVALTPAGRLSPSGRLDIE